MTVPVHEMGRWSCREILCPGDVHGDWIVVLSGEMIETVVARFRLSTFDPAEAKEAAERCVRALREVA